MTLDLTQSSSERIWRSLSDRLRRFVRTRVNSDADVDDILQNVFLRIHQKLPSLRRHDRLEAWVFQITRNAIVDHFRKDRNSQEIDPQGVANNWFAEPENLNNHTSGCVAAMIEYLPEDQRRAVSLYELDKIPQQEIANRESISLSGAKSRIQRGRQNLKAMLLECCQFQFDRRGNVIKCESNIDGSNHCKSGCGSQPQ